MESSESLTFRLLPLIRELWRQQRATDYRTLRSIPSTDVRLFLDYCERRPRAEVAGLEDDLTMRAAHAAARHPWSAGGAPIRAWDRALADKLAGFEYCDLRLLRTAVQLQQRLGRPPVPEEVARRATTAIPCKAPALRRALKPQLGERLGLIARNEGGGDWTYHPISGGRWWLALDFGSMCGQLRWEVVWQYGDEIPLRSVSYTGLLGIGSSSETWDWITETEASSAAALLAELASTCLETLKSAGLLRACDAGSGSGSA